MNSSSFGRDIHPLMLSMPFFLGGDPPGLLRLRGFSLKIACKCLCVQCWDLHVIFNIFLAQEELKCGLVCLTNFFNLFMVLG